MLAPERPSWRASSVPRSAADHDLHLPGFPASTIGSSAYCPRAPPRLKLATVGVLHPSSIRGVRWRVPSDVELPAKRAARARMAGIAGEWSFIHRRWAGRCGGARAPHLTVSGSRFGGRRSAAPMLEPIGVALQSRESHVEKKVAARSPLQYLDKASS